MRAILQTKTGQEVHQTMIPPMKPAPDVVIWGDRVFKLHQYGDEIGGTYGIYLEAFAYAIINFIDPKSVGRGVEVPDAPGVLINNG